MGAGNTVALVLPQKSLNWQQFKLAVSQLAAWLQNHAKPGDRVATWTAKGELACLMPLASARAGLVHVPINPLLKRAQVAHILQDSGACLLIATPGRLATLAADDTPDHCQTFSEQTTLDEAALCEGIGPSPEGTDCDALAAILYTSGSTGKPKGVMLSHANLWLGAEAVAHYLRLAADDVVLAVLPLSFDYGQNQLLCAWRAGACAVALDYLLPRDVIKACTRHSVTTLAAVPPLWVQLLDQPWPDDASASLRRFTNSGGALTPDRVRQLRSRFPHVDLYPMYGLTEAFRSTYLDPSLVDKHPGSIGKEIPFAEVLVVKADGTPTADGEEGELVHCGPLVAKGYWQDAARTAERFKPAPAHSRYGGVAVWSGDRVVREAGGLLRFVGRLDMMIKTAGNRVSPQDIEDAALATGLVAQAVALGIPDERLGHAIKLIVQPNASAQPDLGPNGVEAYGAQADVALRAALKRDLPNFMQPREIVWVSAMPLNPNGKIDRGSLAGANAQ